MKSWADHCSSDEESVDAPLPVGPPVVPEEPEQEIAPEEEEEEVVNDVQGEERVERRQRTYDFPDRPPFTAYVGNLNYNLRENEELGKGLQDLAKDQLGKQIQVVDARVMIDKQQNRSRGFGYVEVESLEQLMTLMELNEKEATLKGRKIQLDTANQRSRRHSHNSQRSSNPEIDGSRFRGGRYANRASYTAGDTAGRARTSLKLQPRTKPVDANGATTTEASSNIFGAGKARDEGAWERGKPQPERRSSKEGGRGAGRSAGGRNSERRGSGGRHAGRGRTGAAPGAKNNTHGRGRGKDTTTTQQASQDPPKTNAPQVAATPEPEKTTVAKKEASSNAFALLMDDSDSD